jgi:membrane protease YdiL (CAAX protease family)
MAQPGSPAVTSARTARAVTTVTRWLPRSLAEKVPRDHRETEAAFQRRRRVTGTAAVAGAGMLGLSLSQPPDSRRFYGLTLAVAATWLTGGLTAGPLHAGWTVGSKGTIRRPWVDPVVTGAGAFGGFYAAALVARRLPTLDRAIVSVLRYAHQGSTPLVLTTALANGLAEEVFFRGALYAAVGADRPVLKTTAVYGLATTATRNPALVLASLAMGLLLGLQRWATGGIQAPVLTHLTWSALMLRYLPPLFAERDRRSSSA